MNENNNVQNQSSKNVYEEFADCIKELALKEEMREKRVTWVEDLEKFSEKQETKTEENVQEDIGTKELPKLPEVVEKKVLTMEDVPSMDELLELYKRKELVEFPSWIIEGENKLKVSPQKLFMHIKKKYHILSVKLGNSEGIVLYLYRDGYYVQWTDSDRKAFIKEHIPTEIREPIHWEKVDKELLTEYANTEESELNSNENIINFRNGIFHLDTGELTPHSPEYLSTIQIPCNYNPNVRLSQAKVFMKFLDDITGGNLDDKITILELIGAIISNIKGWRYKKVIVLKGKGNTGKSKLLDLVIYLVGEENVFTTDIAKLHSQFGLSGIYGKRLLCSGDMKFSKLSEIDKIKELTGGDRVNIEGKFQNSFSAEFSGFMWFNCNDLPAFSGDKGVHVYERFLILLCDNVIPPEKRDAELLDKLKAEGEIIVNIAIKVLQQSIARGYVFTESDRTKNNRKNYKIQNNSLSLFLQDCCIIGEGRVTKKQFKETYKNWCKENNYIYERPNSINKILVEDFEVEEFKSNTEYYRLTIKNY